VGSGLAYDAILCNPELIDEVTHSYSGLVRSVHLEISWWMILATHDWIIHG
jgi:uncharacterized protein with HEPN domain